MNASRRCHRRTRWSIALLLGLTISSLSLKGAAATPNVTNLGKPSSVISSNPYLPLGDFVRVGKSRSVSGLVELLFIGTQWENASAAEEWPVIKALDQFGTFSGVTPLEGWCAHAPGDNTCSNPGFDLDHARFHSEYVTFTYRDLENRGLKCHARLPAPEMALVWANGIKFYRPQGHPPCWFLRGATGEHLPLVRVGGYFQRDPGVAGATDFETFLTPPPGPQIVAGPTTGLSFASVQNSLIKGVDQPGSTLVHDVNAEANIITALICHADHRKPAKVCGRTVITRLLRHVK
jgi:hypothetical protein